MQQRAPLYDKAQEGHYNLISALHKSLRGSDTDAALYWLARMLAGGEDPLYVARRLVRFAVEDVGLADPQALVQALAAWDTYERLGSPEGELALAQCVIYLGTAPKSNAAYTAPAARRNAAARETGSLMPPMHILNAPTRLMKDLGYGKGYDYDHDTGGRLLRPELLSRRHGAARLLPAGRARLRARDQQAARLLGQAQAAAAGRSGLSDQRRVRPSRGAQHILGEDQRRGRQTGRLPASRDRSAGPEGPGPQRRSRRARRRRGCRHRRTA